MKLIPYNADLAPWFIHISYSLIEIRDIILTSTFSRKQSV